jgi:hypothetical protein
MIIVEPDWFCQLLEADAMLEKSLKLLASKARAEVATANTSAATALVRIMVFPPDVRRPSAIVPKVAYKLVIINQSE